MDNNSKSKRFPFLEVAAMFILLGCLVLALSCGWSAAHGFLPVSVLSGTSSSLRLVIRATQFVGLGCILIFIMQAAGRRKCSVLLLTEGVVAVIMAYVLMGSEIAVWQRKVFLRGFATNVGRADVMQDIDSWRRVSLAQIQAEGIAQSQLTYTNLSSRVRGLFPGKNAGTNIGVGDECGKAQDWGIITFSDGASRWGIRVGCTNLFFGWSEELTYPVSNDVRVFFGVVHK